MRRYGKYLLFVLVSAVVFASTAFAASPQDLFDDALAAFNAKNFAKAAKAFGGAAEGYAKAKTWTKAGESAYNQGLCLLRIPGKQSEAATAFLSAAGYYGKKGNAAQEANSRLQAGNTLFVIGEMKKAQEQFELVRKISDVELYLWGIAEEGMGKIAFNEGKLLPAREHYEAAREFFRDKPGESLRVTLQLGQIRRSLGDINGALDLCDEVLERADTLFAGAEDGDAKRGRFRFQALADRGRLTLQMGWLGQAREDLNEALALAKKLGGFPQEWLDSVDLNAALVETQLGNTALAREMFEVLLKKAEKDKNKAAAAVAVANLGQLERMDGQYGRALAHFRRFQKIAEGAGLGIYVTQALNQIADLYYHVGMWGESVAHFQHAFDRALQGGDLETLFTSLLGLFRVEVGRDLGLSGKVDYKTLSGMPWRGTLTVEDLSPPGSRRKVPDFGIRLAWKNAAEMLKNAFLPLDTVEGFRVVAEAAGMAKWTRIEVKAMYYVVDSLLRQVTQRLEAARKATEAVEGLLQGKENALDQEAWSQGYAAAWGVLRRTAGDALLPGRVRPIEVQTSGFVLEGEESEDMSAETLEDAVLEKELHLLASVISLGSLKKEEGARLVKALVAGEVFPEDVRRRLADAADERIVRRAEELERKLANAETSTEATEALSKMLLPLLLETNLSLKRELGALAEGEKWGAYVRQREAKVRSELGQQAELLSKSVSPVMLVRFEEARSLAAIQSAWIRMSLRVSLLKALDVALEKTDSWERFLETFPTAVKRGRTAFDARFALTEHAGQGVAKAKELLALAERLGRMELLYGVSRVNAFVASDAEGDLGFDSRLSMKELLARCALVLGEREKTQALAQEILDLLVADEAGAKRRESGYVSDPEMQWRAQALLGRVALEKKQREEAERCFAQAIDLMENINPLEGGSSQITTERLEVYRFAVENAFALWKAEPSAERAEGLWYLVEHMKSRQWRELLSTTGGVFLGRMPEAKRKELGELRVKLAVAESEFSFKSFRGRRAEIAATSQKISSLRKAINEITKEYTVDAPPPPDAHAVQAVLPKEWNVADFYLSPTLSFSLVLSSEGLRVVPLDVDYDTLFGYVYWLRYRGSVAGENREFLEFEGFKLSPEPRSTVCGLTPEALYERLFRPVAAACGEVRKLLLIPHDILYIFPLETLVFTGADGKKHYLVEEWTFAEVPSAYLLVNRKDTQDKAKASGKKPAKAEKEKSDVLVVANPLYGSLFRAPNPEVQRDVLDEWEALLSNKKGTFSAAFRKALEKEGVFNKEGRLDAQKLFLELKAKWEEILQQTASKDLFASSVKRDFARVITYLKGTKEEALILAKLFSVPMTPPHFLLRENASEKTFRSLDLSKYRYIHFACHGYDRGTIPDLQPGLALSPADDPENDSFLQMGEMATLSWNADLVSLSACETGLGELFVGDGMQGLATVLLAGGNKGAVLSRWTVPDSSAPLFMARLYSGVLKGYAGPEALREAQREFLSMEEGTLPDGTTKEARHWAVFKFVGIPW